jgi:hypothetical protein
MFHGVGEGGPSWLEETWLVLFTKEMEATGSSETFKPPTKLDRIINQNTIHSLKLHAKQAFRSNDETEIAEQYVCHIKGLMRKAETSLSLLYFKNILIIFSKLKKNASDSRVRCNETSRRLIRLSSGHQTLASPTGNTSTGHLKAKAGTCVTSVAFVVR